MVGNAWWHRFADNYFDVGHI